MAASASNPMREWARRYVEHGFKVFPTSGKVPVVTNGVHDAKGHDAPLDTWWPDTQHRDIAIAMGAYGPDGKILFSVDMDPRNGGVSAWIELVAGRELPETPLAHSGRGDGGTHFYFYAPAGWTHFPKGIGKGIDIKGPGGYLIAPPSLHTETRDAYTWERDPWACPIADAPQWLLEAMKAKSGKLGIAAAPVADYLIIGERDDTLISIAGTIRNRGMTAEEIAPMLREVNRNRCRPPLPESDILRIASSAGRMDANDPIVPGDTQLATIAITGVELAKALPPATYLVKELAMLAGSGPPHIFAGFGYSGKTIIHMMMNLGLASGRSIWKGFFNSEKLRVTHVDGEQGIWTTQLRYQREARAIGEQLEEIGDRLRVIPFPKMRSGKPLRLVQEHRNAWLELMAERDVICLDSFDALRDPAVKQSDSEVRAGLDLLTDISEETKCRPSVIHHANKASLDAEIERDPRTALAGSQGIFASADAVFLLMAQEGESVLVRQIKTRAPKRTAAPFAITISDVEAEGDPEWGLAVAMAGAELIAEQKEKKRKDKLEKQSQNDCKRVLEALRKHLGGLGRDELMAQACLNGSRLAAVTTLLKGRMEVRNEKDGRTWRKRFLLTSGMGGNSPVTDGNGSDDTGL